MVRDPRKLADAAITQVHDLTEDIHAGRVGVAHQDYAINALHLVRDALLDLDALHLLLHDLIRRQSSLIKVQIDERIFHGPNHVQYHRNAAQIRAVLMSGHQHAKRLLNQCAYVTDAFIAHGTSLRAGSFGKQYASLSGLDRRKITDPRSIALISLLESRGEKLELHNDFRDKYIEHITPRRKGRQPRPATSRSGITHLDAETIRPVPGHVYQIEPGWVHMQVVSDEGVPFNVFHVHAQGAFKQNLPPLDENFGGIIPETKLMTRGHFRHTEYHTHSWIQEDLEDEPTGFRPVGVAQSDFDDVFEDVVTYTRDLIFVCRNGRLPGDRTPT